MILAQAIRLIILSTISFLVAILATSAVLKFLKHYQFGKQIRTADEAPVFSQMHKKKEGTPTAGGVVIWGTTIALAMIFWVMSLAFDGSWTYLNFVSRSETYLPLAALFIAAILGLLDDWMGIKHVGTGKGGGISMGQKVLIYTLLAAIGAWWFRVRLDWTVLSIPFVGTVNIGSWYIPVFMFIVIASAFSANETDGLDGLLGGTALVAFAALTAVAFILGRYDLAAFGGVVIGSLLAFLWFNIYPAKFFMGDTGSMAIGISIGVIAMLTNTALLLPLFAFIWLIESLSVIVQTFWKKVLGHKLFHSTPIHHHFEALGWPESQVTMRFWIISGIASALGLIIFFLSRI
jgi:phospho-N-acetylmuramoyl-pentapeptide-transferase